MGSILKRRFCRSAFRGRGPGVSGRRVFVGLLLSACAGPALWADVLDEPASLEGHPAAPRWHEVPLPDQRDWSAKRRSAWQKTVQRDLGRAAAVVEIPSLELVVPVFMSSARPYLELGAGWVEGTAQPGESGNVALAGHRDSYFRPLEGLSEGATVQLATESGVLRYEVDDIRIVDALDVSVLEPTDDAVLTLITCYPFRYAGFAPDRFIVRARRVPESPSVAAE
jgi:sortase A